jgi:hypothetical protein
MSPPLLLVEGIQVAGDRRPLTTLSLIFFACFVGWAIARIAMLQAAHLTTAA